MPTTTPQLKQSRGKYSRLICLNCRERRIRCELPADTSADTFDRPRRVHTPCYRCRRQNLECIVRKTTLGRPTGAELPPKRHDAQAALSLRSRIVIEFPRFTSAIESPLPSACDPRQDSFYLPVTDGRLMGAEEASERSACSRETLLLHKPQSTETLFIIRAIDTIKCESCEQAWPRHLAVRVGRVPVLDLSIKAIVAACAHARGVPKLTREDCYLALAAALRAMHIGLLSPGISSSDDMLAAVALLAPFEGVMKKSDVPMRSHIEGLAAVMASRPAAFPISQLSRDILDFHAYDASVMACIQGVASPLEDICPGYYASQAGQSDSGQAQLRALGIELLIRLPRLVHFARLLCSPAPSDPSLLIQALGYAKRLLQLVDANAENALFRTVAMCRLEAKTDSPLRYGNIQYESAEDYEGAAYYWQGRLWLLRLCCHLHTIGSNMMTDSTTGRGTRQSICHASFDLTEMEAELGKYVGTVAMSMEYASHLRLRKRRRLFAQSIVLLWGALRDVPEVFLALRDNDDRAMLRCTLLLYINCALAADPELTGSDMDQAADILQGGSRRGYFAELFGLSMTS